MQFEFFYCSMPQGMVLWSAKVPKALCQSNKVASRWPKHIKKTAALCFVFKLFIILNSRL